MKILKFNEDFIPGDIRVKLEKTGWDKPNVKYYVALADSFRIPSSTISFNDLNSAIDNLNTGNKRGNIYWIFESKLRPLTQEEINLYLDTKKYNL